MRAERRRRVADGLGYHPPRYHRTLTIPSAPMYRHYVTKLVDIEADWLSTAEYHFYLNNLRCWNKAEF